MASHVRLVSRLRDDHTVVLVVDTLIASDDKIEHQMSVW